jgi:ATP-dependent Clp protease, protease subunit
MKDNDGQQGFHELMFFQQPQDSQSIKCYKQTIPINIYHFYITEEIEDYKQYQDLINILKTAEETDKIIIYLNSPGGCVYTTIQIINSMRASKATVITSMDGLVCSAATMIFLSGHEYIVNNNCSFMIHNYSGGLSGKGHEMVSRLKHEQGFFEQLAYDIYGGFLEDSEIKSMLDGVDIWMDSKEVLKRLHIMLEKKKEEYEAEETPEEVVEVKPKPVTKKKPAVKKKKR